MVAAPTFNHRRGTRASTGNCKVTSPKILLAVIILILGFVLYQQDQASWESASLLEHYAPLASLAKATGESASLLNNNASLASLTKATVTPPTQQSTSLRSPVEIDNTSTKATVTPPTEQSTSFKSPVEIDIISIGSNTRPSYLDAQERTFGSHVAFRDFHRITEANDYEAECHSSLKLDQVKQIVEFCRKRSPVFSKHPTLKKMKGNFANFNWLNKKFNPPGWMCAQKRPADGFYAVLSSYKETGKSLPDYLFIMDDDTYVNMNEVAPFLQTTYPATEAYAVAGCMIRSRVNEQNFTSPFGGFATILSRPAIENFQKPLFCAQYQYNNTNVMKTTADDDDFESLACWRLSQDPVGEASVFVEGMSVAELMHAYVKRFDYTGVGSWKTTSVGFCMHSDWVWGYFINFYHIAVHSDTPKVFANVLEDRLRGYNDSVLYAGKQTVAVKAAKKVCWNEIEQCQASSPICHYMTPDAMDKLHGAARELAPDQFRQL
jgi:hypothetical protein